MRNNTSLKRKVGSRDRKKKIFIFSEGESTEPSYFTALSRYSRSAIVEVICEKGGGAPQALFDKAERRKSTLTSKSYIKENGSDDAVWIAFDQDDFHGIPQIIEKSKKLNIGVAYSNPCFEVWLILHEQDYDAAEHRSKTQKVCEKVCSGYDRKTRKVPNLSRLMTKVAEAEIRAAQMTLRRNNDSAKSPFTTVHDLTSAIRKN